MAGYPLQFSCQENSMDRGAWQTAVHGVAKSQTRLNQLTGSLMLQLRTHAAKQIFKKKERKLERKAKNPKMINFIPTFIILALWLQFGELM